MVLLDKLKQIEIEDNFDTDSDEGWSPLMFAATKNNVEATKFLIDHGAYLCHRSKKNKSVLMIAAATAPSTSCNC